MKKNLTFIKLGGSVITKKEVSRTVRSDVLQRLVNEISRAARETNDLYIIGHGQGSYAHEPALRYKTMDGFISPESPFGMAVTQDSAAQLNRIVVGEFLAQSIPAVSFYGSNSMVVKDGNMEHFSGAVLEEYLEKGLLPITGGDVLVDSFKGCTIWSTEKILGFLAEYFSKKNMYQVKQLLHVTEVAGVLDTEGTIIPRITKENYSEVEKLIGGTKGFDVTGGMGHKLEESMKLAELGMTVGIVSGLKENAVYDFLIGKEVVGTRITA